jgi:hypothetical protein
MILHLVNLSYKKICQYKALITSNQLNLITNLTRCAI